MLIWVVIRTAGERTAPLCEEVVRRWHSNYEVLGVTVINISPAVRACEEVFRIGASMPGVDLLLKLDADIILCSKALKTIEDFWTTYSKADPRLAFLNCQLLDKFRGDVLAGAYVYSNALSPDLHDLFQRQTERAKHPESTAVYRFLKKRGLTKAILPVSIGLHDFGQWSRDAYRKGATRSARDMTPESAANLVYKLQNRRRSHDEDAFLRGLLEPGVWNDFTKFPSLPDDLLEVSSIGEDERRLLFAQAEALL